MTDRPVRLPSERQPPVDWNPPLTTPPRSWAELVETLHGGLAVIDDSWRLTFVSDRFVPVFGRPADLVGHDLRQLLPALADDDPRGFGRQVEQRERVEFEQQFLVSADERRWYQITVAPSVGLEDDVFAVVFARDITASSSPLASLRDATVGLTEIEGELHQRAGRDVHDGPIQLLAALMFRLGMSDSDEAKDLQQIVSDVAAMLRQVIAEFTPEPRRPEGTLIEQWIAPLIADSGIEVTVADHRATESSQAEVQAAFVLLYQVVRGMKFFGGPRAVRLVLSDENWGERTVVSFPSSAERSMRTGRSGAQYRAIVHHARSLGGTLSTWIDDDEVRWISMWIPKLAGTAPGVAAVPATVRRRHGPTRTNDVSQLRPLVDARWTELADAAPERLVEFDGETKISFSNAVEQELMGTAPDALVGLSMRVVFPAESLVQLDSTFERLALGQFVETEWYRENPVGDPRLVHLRASPRLDREGRFLGVLVATEDRTEVELLESLYQTALADLVQARRVAIERSIRLLRQPLAACALLIERLERSADTLPQRDSVLTITTELRAALRRIEGSTSVLMAPRLSVDQLGDALQASLGTLLVGRQLSVIDNSDRSPAPEIVDVVFGVAREATNNAVLHGGADQVTITVETTDDGVSCQIHDNGIGVEPERLRHRPGHLGTRAMKERARERGGTCIIERHPEGGTVVSLWLPDRTAPPPLVNP